MCFQPTFHRLIAQHVVHGHLQRHLAVYHSDQFSSYHSVENARPIRLKRFSILTAEDVLVERHLIFVDQYFDQMLEVWPKQIQQNGIVIRRVHLFLQRKRGMGSDTDNSDTVL